VSSLLITGSPTIRRDETVQVALLLAFAGGYLDARNEGHPGPRAWPARGRTVDRLVSLQDAIQ
jgi:hypothetical protein